MRSESEKKSSCDYGEYMIGLLIFLECDMLRSYSMSFNEGLDRLEHKGKFDTLAHELQSL